MQGHDLPSLDLLKGFEAAARNLSFTRAAGELFVTQSAISRQVKALEEQLGFALFRRRHRALLLTEQGQSLYKTAAEVLRLLRDATGKLHASGRSILTVTSTVSFASLWLVPRLNAFRRLHPEFDVRIDASNNIQDLDRDGIDLAVRYCSRKTAGVGAVRLFGEQVFPVCAKELIDGRELKSPQDLSRFVLLHFEGAEKYWPWVAWNVWLERARAEDVEPAGMLRFSHYDQMIQAAIEGQGIALGRSPLLDRWIRNGQLVRPFGRRFMSSSSSQSYAYFIVFSTAAERHSEAAAFARWLQEEARAAVAEAPSMAREKAPRRPRKRA